MSKADKMFKELGYKEKHEGNDFVEYLKPNKEDEIYHIEFNKKDKLILAIMFNELIVKAYPYQLDMQELQAINEKCKELGWLDE